MTSNDEKEMWRRVGMEYNAPDETPRDEIWARIDARIGGGEETPATALGQRGNGPSGRGAGVLDLASARRRRATSRNGGRAFGRAAGWAVAAAALVVMGVGIGRTTVSTTPPDVAEATPPARSATDGNGLAARAHLGRTEALLTMVKADGRDGRVDPAVAEWAEDLLLQTRLLLDRPEGADPELRVLLLDLELVLAQVVGVAKPDADADDERTRTEVQLTLKSLDEGEVLPRIQARLPPTFSGA